MKANINSEDIIRMITVGIELSENHGMYTCPMHPEIKLNHAGNCPICCMPLVPMKSAVATSARISNLLEA